MIAPVMTTVILETTLCKPPVLLSRLFFEVDKVNGTPTATGTGSSISDIDFEVSMPTLPVLPLYARSKYQSSAWNI
jgi:hypothetical protein